MINIFKKSENSSYHSPSLKKNNNSNNHNNSSLFKLLPIEIIETIFKYVIGDQINSQSLSASNVFELFHAHSIKDVCRLWRSVYQTLITHISIVGCFRNKYCVSHQIKAITSIIYNESLSQCTLPRLKSIQLNLGLDSESLQQLITPLSHYLKHDLTSINLSNNYLTTQSIKILKNLLMPTPPSHTTTSTAQQQSVVMPKLKLNLSNNMIGFEGVKSLSKYLSIRCNLVELDLANNHLNNSGTKLLLMSMIYNTSIRSLNISGNYISRDCMVYIIELFKYNQTLEHLDLSFNWIQDSSYVLIQSILTSQYRKQPIQLDLSYNKILDEGLKRINTLLSEQSINDQYSPYPIESLILTGNDACNGKLVDQVQDTLFKQQQNQLFKLQKQHYRNDKDDDEKITIKHNYKEKEIVVEQEKTQQNKQQPQVYHRPHQYYFHQHQQQQQQQQSLYVYN